MTISSSRQVFAKALRLSALLVGVVALLGSGLGYLFAGTNGVISALIGAGISLLFSVLTILSISLGSRLPLGGFYGLVLGGWLLKLVLFAVLLGLLRQAEFVSGPVLFFALVGAILGGLGIDSYVALKARVPVVEN
jgi:hypothetical protein